MLTNRNRIKLVASIFFFLIPMQLSDNLTKLYDDLYTAPFPLRQYPHVKQFYANITQDAIKIAKQYYIPPAALLAIAGLESGYGNGYIAKITGNILSLGAKKSEMMLPAVTVATCEGKVLLTPSKIDNCAKEKLRYDRRPPSFKRDYRPAAIAKSSRHLGYFETHPEQKRIAYYHCMKDFATQWINEKNSNKNFADARKWLNKIVQEEGLDTLFSPQTNAQFINMIGGRKNSFNYRKTWPKKVIKVMHNGGLIKLCRQIYEDNVSFNEAWGEN
jgi:hypothetical protein